MKTAQFLSAILLTASVLISHGRADLIVDLDATTLPIGAVTTVTNNGTLGGNFGKLRLDGTTDANNGTAVTAIAKNDASGTVNALTFDGAADYLISSGVVPSSLNGDSVRSVEVWAYNPALGAEEAMLTWSRRGGGNGTHQAFNYGNNPSWGALGHWGTTNDVGWGIGNAVNAPAAGQWHHLVYTYDGVFDRLYVNGVLVNQEYMRLTVLNTAGTYSAAPNNGVATRFALAAQMANTGIPDAGTAGSMSIAKARVRNEVLTPAAIRTNYNSEASTFGRAVLPGPSIKTFTVSPTVFAPGQQITFTYDIPGATNLTIDNGVGTLTGSSGTKVFTPSNVTTTFTLTATDASGDSTAQVRAHFRDQLPVLRHRYSFNEGTGTTVNDSVGAKHGTIRGTPFLWNETALTAGNRAGQLVLNNGAGVNTTGNTSAYVDLPNGLLTERKDDFTFEGWVTNEIAQFWARVFDFGTTNFGENTAAVAYTGGNSTGTEFLFLSAQEGDTTTNQRYALKRDNAEDGATIAGGVALGTQWHFAVAYDIDGNAGSPQLRFYRNGVLVGTTNTTKSAQGFLDVNCWLGRSNFTGDRTMAGSFNEFRVYDGAFNATDAATSFAQGPNTVYDPTNTPASITKEPVNVTVAKNGIATFTTTAIGSSPLAYQWYRNGTPIPGATAASYTLSPATVVDDGSTFHVVVSNNPLSGPASDTSNTVTLNVDYAGEALRNRYPFTGNLVDVIGGANGTGFSNNGGALPTAAATALTLNAGTQQYLTLPPSGTNALNIHTFQQVTFESWASFATLGNWARLFDIGVTNAGNTQGWTYLMFSPRSGAGATVFSMTADTNNIERAITRIPSLENGGMFHIVCVCDPTTGKMQMYLNGVLAVQSTFTGATPLADLSVIGTSTNGTYKAYIGRSLYNDAFVTTTIDEFRIYNVALTADEVASNYAAGPNAVPTAPTTISFNQQPTSQTVSEPNPVTFSADVNGPKPVTVQWFKNDVLIPGATSLKYTYTPTPADNGATFFCRAAAVVSGNPATLDSNTVTLTVNADVTAPTLAFAQNTGLTTVTVGFSEAVSPAAAGNLANYALSGGLTISAISLSSDQKTATLTTSAMTIGSSYTLTVNNINDLAASPNTIAANSQLTFTTTPFTLIDFGSPSAPGILGTGGGGYTLTALGNGPTNASDEFSLAAQTLTGDFDLQTRISSLGLSDIWARAGIMARGLSGATDVFAAAVATPGVAGTFFSYRFPAGATAQHAGGFPTNYPNTWVRLKRAGNLFTAYASLNGASWTPISSNTLALPSTLQVGPFVSSASKTVANSATFFNYGPTANMTVVNNPQLPFEPDGPSSRRSIITVTEFMYNPNPVNGTGNLEFIELHNTAPYQEDLSGWQIKGGISYTFPGGTILKPGAYLVVAAVPANVQAAYSITGVYGPWTGSLSNGGEDFRIENENGSTMAEIDYKDSAPWPIGAAGLGHSLVLARPSYGEADARAWAISNQLGGSPGRRDPYEADAASPVIINEFLANTELPTLDFIELFNSSNATVDISGLVLGDGALLTAGYTIPPGTTIPARGYLSFDETTLGFSLGSDGERVWLYRPGVRMIDAISFTGQDIGVSRNHELRELAAPTPGTVNSAEKERPVVINEIMYNPISELSADEYIELYNKSASPVSLDGWIVSGDIDFTIPAGTTIPANGYLVIAKDAANLLGKGYATLSASNCVGNYTGSLPNRGGHIALRLPVTHLAGVAYATVDEVSYSDGGRWGMWSDGGGSSLELRDARADNRLGSNWGDSDETAKSSYTTLTVTGTHDNRHPTANGVANRAEFYLQGPGECLIDDLDVRDSTNTISFLTNGNFDSGIGAWVPQGNQKQAAIQASGAASSPNCLRLLASDRGDTGANRVRSALTTTLTDNATYRLNVKVRWLRGSRYFNFRIRGNGLELPGVLDVPTTLGSPGAVNSIATPNVGPAIHSVAHAPVLPAAAENVIVTAQIADPDGVGTVNLIWRNDTDAGAANTVAMNDAGTAGDAYSGDGIYSGQIPGQATGKLIAFKIQATDTSGAPITATFPTTNPVLFPATLQTRECYVRFGESVQYGTLGSYRLWTSNATLTEWNNREKNSNQPLDATFVIGNYRAFYNVSTQYSGSPHHAPAFTGPLGANPTDFEVVFNSDDRFLGTSDFVIQAQNGANFTADATCQAELTAFWMSRKMGLLSGHKRHVHLFFNGVRRAIIYEDAEQPNSLVVEQHLRSQKDGTLYKIEDWFEFDDAGAAHNHQNANLPATTTTINGVPGQKKMARYRNNWRIRGQADPNEYTPIFDLVDAVNAANTPTDTAFVAGMNNLVDMENWLGTILAHHIVGNWDAYGYERGKNSYAFKPDNGKWVQLTWDMDFAFGAQSREAGSDIFAADPNGANADRGQPETAKLFNTPAFRRQYLAAARRAALGPLSGGQIDTLVDARYTDFVNNGLTPASPDTIKQFVNDRRTYLLNVQPTATLALTSPTTVTTPTSTITITGVAPAEVSTISINGLDFPIRWTSVTNWAVDVTLLAGLNTLTITASDVNNVTVGTLGPISATFTGTNAWGTVLFNEWMATNTTILDPADGEAEDWIELLNPTGSAINLAGWIIEDSGASFTIPTGYSIAAGGRLIVWADDEPIQNTGSGQLHVPFKLSASGETLTLRAPDTSVIDSVTFGGQVQNISSGRVPDGSATLNFLSSPTLGAANSAAVADSVPSISRSGNDVTFSITTTPGFTYVLQYSDDMTANSWTNLAASQVATGTSISVVDPNPTEPRRFYRGVRTP